MTSSNSKIENPSFDVISILKMIGEMKFHTTVEAQSEQIENLLASYSLLPLDSLHEENENETITKIEFPINVPLPPGFEDYLIERTTMPQTTGPTKLTDYILTSITWGVVKRSNNKFAFQFVKKRTETEIEKAQFLHSPALKIQASPRVIQTKLPFKVIKKSSMNGIDLNNQLANTIIIQNEATKLV